VSYLKIFKIKKSNLKKERIPSSTKEKTVSTEQYETTQRYPHLATRPFITRPTLIAGRCATSHDTERFRVFVWHVFAATDIERTFCQYARGCALLGCDIDTFSPLLTSSGPSVSTRAAAHYAAVTLTSSSPPVSTSRVCATATRILTLTSLTQFCASRYGAAAHHEVCDYVSVRGAASHYAAIDIDERDAVLRTTIRRDRASRAACDFEERDAFCASDGTRHIAEHGATLNLAKGLLWYSHDILCLHCCHSS
jgi:hypothetical protein